MNPPPPLGLLIKQLREQRGMSHVDLGRAIGVSHTTIGRIESGFIEAPDPAKLQRLAEVFEIDVEELMIHHPTVAHGLPGYGTYLRAKTGMSDAAITEAETFLRELEQRDKGGS